MELSRRDFLKASGAGFGSFSLLGALTEGVALAGLPESLPLKKKIGEDGTIAEVWLTDADYKVSLHRTRTPRAV